ncbi:hypothetical protein M514_13941 [Trichuris suis]|uniref:Uncharacterized protein n=1 Tax=Trichuris suis TaxID=68888 RepID=A0A085MQH7_9BILA|nr:hypothetical protein M513_13941 [Trichuris suis]KFD59473.1 hypothetical protein M514_13941 [Trichuris suis]
MKLRSPILRSYVLQAFSRSINVDLMVPPETHMRYTETSICGATPRITTPEMVVLRNYVSIDNIKHVAKGSSYKYKF